MRSVPFSEAHQLNHDFSLRNTDEKATSTAVLASKWLPGYPYRSMEPESLVPFLQSEFCDDDLEKLGPHLWLMSTQSSSNISPLHRQIVKNREIVVTEDPRLHLGWGWGRIFIKPIPKYLLSYSFWSLYLLDETKSPLGKDRNSIKRAALGYLRTYKFLIKYESDFRLAQSDRLCLIPSSVNWTDYCHFVSTFDEIQDDEVSERYNYGELRLRRLNHYGKLFLGKWAFHRVHSDYTTYFSRFGGPFIFAFGLLSVILNAMQVGMTIEQLSRSPWIPYQQVCRVLSLISFFGVLLLCFLMFSLFFYRFYSEWDFAIRQRLRLKASRRGAAITAC
ncbi:MAG: hypothetical protein M1814_000696 [Vezdaea aestivalis]|nr:MAG: hypothetical protein M1814_000696 [Vezdaea aestivalis]